MVLAKDDYVMAVCSCCLDITSQKRLLDIGLNYRDGSTVTLIHSCPSCGKQSKAEYNLVSQGPLDRRDGFQIKGYEKERRKGNGSGKEAVHGA